MEFVGWPKTPRLFRDAIITEKIDGTNGCIIIEPAARVGGNELRPWAAPPDVIAFAQTDDGAGYYLGAQSRNRILTQQSDNAGFGQWVWANADALVAALGPGRHYGEWWGHGIQRGYGLPPGDRRFSLFNTSRFRHLSLAGSDVPGLATVPVLTTRTFNSALVLDWLDELKDRGSMAAPGFMRPEGVCVYHTASGQVWKALIENDDRPKGLAARIRSGDLPGMWEPADLTGGATDMADVLMAVTG